MSSAGKGTNSLERSLGKTLGILVLVVLVVISLGGAWVGRQAMEQFVASRLAHDAEAIVAVFDPATGFLAQTIPPVYGQPLSGHYYVIQGEDFERIRSRSLWDTDLPLDKLESGASQAVLMAGPREQTLFVWQAGYQRQGHTFTLSVAEDISPLLDSLQRFLIVALAAALITFVLLIVFQRRILRRGFKQIDAVREDLHQLSLGEPGRLREEVPAEVQPLVAEFNGLISAWQGHLKRSRNAMGNLAHSLKSPLQILLQHGRDMGDKTIAVQAERMQQIVDRELRQVRFAGTAVASGRFQPTSDIPDLVKTLKALHSGKTLSVSTDIRLSGYLSLDQEDMLELLGNLLDNAAKWAKQNISVTAERIGQGSIQLVVEDDGPGIDYSYAGNLLARGSRLDETMPGHGLGLSIARDIADLYNGHIRFERSERLGGLAVQVKLQARAMSESAGMGSEVLE